MDGRTDGRTEGEGGMGWDGTDGLTVGRTDDR